MAVEWIILNKNILKKYYPGVIIDEAEKIGSYFIQ